MRRNLALTIGLVLGLAAGLLWWWKRTTKGDHANRDGHAASVASDHGFLPQEAAGPTARRLPQLPQDTTSSPAPPIIDDISIEKSEVCEGEENLATVRAHTSDGNDAFLHYLIGPSRGARVALRSYLDDRGTPTAHRLSVFSKRDVATTVPVPAFRVKKCHDLSVAVIDYRLLPNRWADFEFAAKVVPALARSRSASPASAFRARSYQWVFESNAGDDRAVVQTGSATVTHSFARRRQDTLYSNVLVTLEVLGEDGRMVRARQSLELRNPAFESFAAKGIVQLMVELDPRFPVLQSNGVVEQAIQLWHAGHHPIEITRVTRVRRLREVASGSSSNSSGTGKALGDTAAPETLPVASVLGATTISPGAALVARVALDTRAEPDTLSYDYFIEGRTPEGHPVRGAFSVMRPPARPTKDHHQAVDDPHLMAKIKRARELLGAAYVTDEDLWRLERAGRFAGVQPDASPSATAGDRSTPATPGQ